MSEQVVPGLGLCGWGGSSEGWESCRCQRWGPGWISISGWFGGMWRSSRRRVGWFGSRGSGARDPSCGSPAPASKALARRRSPVKAPPGPTTIAHGVLVGWSAARVEHRGRVWKSARELAVERERWAVRVRCERGYSELLPDLAVWLKRSEPPVAVIAEAGGRREDRQKMILEGWRDGIEAGHYSAVHYHCANEAVEHWITRLARKVGLTGVGFPAAAVQMSAEEIAALPPAADDPNEQPSHQQLARSGSAMPAQATLPPAPVPENAPPEPQTETAEAVAERERAYREIFGFDQPQRRRRWRR